MPFIYRFIPGYAVARMVAGLDWYYSLTGRRDASVLWHVRPCWLLGRRSGIPACTFLPPRLLRSFGVGLAGGKTRSNTVHSPVRPGRVSRGST